jgi:hypothetical protein
MLLKLIASMPPLLVAAGCGMILVYMFGKKEGDFLILDDKKWQKVTIVVGSSGVALAIVLAMLGIN